MEKVTPPSINIARIPVPMPTLLIVSWLFFIHELWAKLADNRSKLFICDDTVPLVCIPFRTLLNRNMTFKFNLYINLEQYQYGARVFSIYEEILRTYVL